MSAVSHQTLPLDPAPVNITEVQWHFAIPIYTKFIVDYQAHRQPLLDLLRERFTAQLDLESGLYRQSSWRSEANIHLLQHPSVQWLNREIGAMARDCISSRQPQLAEFDVLMEACWATFCTQGGWNPPHNHYPAQWSGVFYLDVEQAVNTDVPDDKSGKVDFFNPIPVSAGFGLPTSVTYTPKDGLMMLYPAMLQHMTHPLTRDTGRYAIAFNLNIIPRSINRV